MTDTNRTESKLIYMPRSEAESTYEALRHYLNAFGEDGDAYGQGGIRAFRRTYGDSNCYLWEHMWFGQNHQRIAIGDTVRLQSPNDAPEFVEAEVLDVTTFAAFLLDQNGAEWHVWPLVHRTDRLHTEPDFDHTHWVPVQRHMGYQVQPEDAAAYEQHCAEHGTRQPHLSVVKDVEGGGLP